MFENLFSNLDFKKELTGLTKIIVAKKELKKLNAELKQLEEIEKGNKEKSTQIIYDFHSTREIVRTLKQAISFLKEQLEEKTKSLDSCLLREKEAEKQENEMTQKKAINQAQIQEKENRIDKLNGILVAVEKESQITLAEVI